MPTDTKSLSWALVTGFTALKYNERAGPGFTVSGPAGN
jgi:hypothetical protein